jgi:hypothetical protein
MPPAEFVVPPTLPPVPPVFIVDEPQPIAKTTNTTDSNRIPEINEARHLDMALTPFAQTLRNPLASGTPFIAGTVKNSRGSGTGQSPRPVGARKEPAFRYAVARRRLSNI